MNGRFIGEIDSFPWLTVKVRTQAGIRDIKFLVDTGFSGEFAIPRPYAALFGTSTDTFSVRFANGEEQENMIVRCQVDWLDGPREATAVYIDGDNPLLGMELLDECIVTLVIENGQGEMTIESNQEIWRSQSQGNDKRDRSKR